MKNPLHLLKSERGVALLIAISAVILIAFIAVELSYDAMSEYLIASDDIKRLKAHYAAKAGIEIGLLRIKIYQKVRTQFKDQLQGNTQVIDGIWKTPFMWPPQLPPESNRVE